MQGYVVDGCLPAASPTLTLTVPPCRAYTREQSDPPTLKGFEEATARSLTLPAGDGVVWLGGRWNLATTPPGWTCQPGVHYCWLSSATAPAWPSGLAPLARLTRSGGAVTLVEPLLSHSPLPMTELAGTTYATQFGLTCDGVSDNSAALEAAIAALPPSGGIVLLPAAEQPCNFSRPLVLTQSISLQGPGGTRAGPKTTRARLRYTGSGTAITISGGMAQGAKLIGFELDHSGTADYGVRIDGTSSIFLQDFGVVLPEVPFAIAAIAVGLDAPTSVVHSLFIQNCYLRAGAPTGLWLANVDEFAVVVNSKILRHTDNNVLLGRLATPGPPGTADDVHILHSSLENPEPGSNAVRIHRAEGVWITDSHFEIGPPDGSAVPARALLIHATTERAAPVVLRHNRFTALPGATEVIAVNFGSALVNLTDNWFSSNAGASLPAYIANTLALQLVVGGNRAEGAALLSSVNRTTLRGNWDIASGQQDGFLPSRQCQSAAIAGSAGTGETTLATCTLAAQTLYQDGMGVALVAGGITANNANLKRIRAYIGTAQIFDSGAVVAQNDHWFLECDGVRSTALGMRISCRGQFYDVQPGSVVVNSDISTAGWDGARAFSVTGNGTTDNDVTLRVWRLQVVP